MVSSIKENHCKNFLKNIFLGMMLETLKVWMKAT